MTNTKNAINWFEIPVTDMARAVRFYETVLATTLHREVFGGHDHSIFRVAEPGVAGALVKAPHLEPSGAGSRVYLHTGELDACIARVAGAGGAVIMPRTDIGEPGFIAIVRDTEGNAVGLHQPR